MASTVSDVRLPPALKSLLTFVDDPAVDGTNDLNEYRRGWQLRRDLAELSRRPEGFHFRFRASDGRIYGAPLLTPPDMEAVQRADGSWFRTRRYIDRHNPIPYSEQWYAEYLHHFGLPTYFLRAGHLAMMYDDAEPNKLHMFNAPSPQYATIPPRGYLDLRFHATPCWPRQDPKATYRLELQTEGGRASLAHHHPALSITEFPYRTYVRPSGHIQLRSMVEDKDWKLLVHAEEEVQWDEFEHGHRVISSYHREITGLHPASQPSTPREAHIQAAIDNHAIINPMEDMPGQGSMIFLSDHDYHNAFSGGYVDAQGLPDPHTVNAARMRGDLAVGTGLNAGPITVWIPDPALRNPAVDPVGPGAWRFLTSDGVTSNRGFAAINFGGSHGLPTHPTASQIRRLGQLFVADGRQNLADMIDIVWVAGEEDDEPGVDPVLDATVETEEDEVSPSRTRARRSSGAAASAANLSSPSVARRAASTADGVDPNQDPTNGSAGGEHDQTGGGSAVYCTAFNRGRYVTIDRSRAWVGDKEPHKFWCYGARGWKKWPRWQEMDWEDKKKVSDLNKHREQTHQRANIWERKRTEPREDYSQQELEYVMGLVSAAGGERPEEPLAVIAAEFNRRFSAHRRRNDTGIQSLVDRLRKEYQEFGGLRPRKGRGWKQQEASKELRGAVKSLKGQQGKESDEEDELSEGSEADAEGEVESEAEGEAGGEGEGETGE